MDRKTDGGGCRIKDFMKPGVGYVRVSTERQGKDGISLEAQKDAIKRFTEKMGYTLTEIYQDDASGVGEKSFHRRDGLQKALDHARRENADLIVWDWDRLSRYGRFEKQIRKVLGDTSKVICVKEGTRFQDASQAASFEHAERQRNEISLRTKDGMAKKRAEGAVFGNPHISTRVQPTGGPVPHLCRPRCSFKPSFVRKRPGFSSPILSAVDADCRSR